MPTKQSERAFESFLRDKGYPYVSVIDAKRAIAANPHDDPIRRDEKHSTLRPFHFVIYGDGANLLIWLGGPTARNRRDMEAWADLFGEGFRAVWVKDPTNPVMRDAEGIVVPWPVTHRRFDRSKPIIKGTCTTSATEWEQLPLFSEVVQ